MHKLLREVRFCVNPFLANSTNGGNSYCCRPGGDGLAVYFALWIELLAGVDKDTGFVVNVVDIDKAVRRYVVPVFDGKVKESFKQSQHVSLTDLYDLLGQGWAALKDKFENASLISVGLNVMPHRRITINSEDLKLITISEKFEFAATHKLWNESFSDQKNFEVFGKCANPNGHGHNYIVEITVAIDDKEKFSSYGFEGTVDKEFISIVDHKNLNADVEEFARVNPTVENITTFAWGCLKGKFSNATLHSITIWESDRMCCTFSG